MSATPYQRRRWLCRLFHAWSYRPGRGEPTIRVCVRCGKVVPLSHDGANL